jgi:uncharacterized protein YeaO (DUF488 family)
MDDGRREPEPAKRPLVIFGKGLQALARTFGGSYRSAMAIGVVRLGSPRGSREGLRLGTVRRPPRGVAKRDFARLDYYDLWLPDLAPSAPLVAYALSQPLTSKRWAVYSRRYRREMAEPAQSRLIALLAALSRQADCEVGCYCADESRCHRSLLRQLLVEAGAAVVGLMETRGARR